MQARRGWLTLAIAGYFCSVHCVFELQSEGRVNPRPGGLAGVAGHEGTCNLVLPPWLLAVALLVPNDVEKWCLRAHA